MATPTQDALVRSSSVDSRPASSTPVGSSCTVGAANRGNGISALRHPTAPAAPAAPRPRTPARSRPRHPPMPRFICLATPTLRDETLHPSCSHDAFQAFRSHPTVASTASPVWNHPLAVLWYTILVYYTTHCGYDLPVLLCPSANPSLARDTGP